MARKKEKVVSKLSAELPKTVKLDGLNWKVISRRVKANWVYLNKDEKGNPSVGVKHTEYVNPADLDVIEKTLKNKYDNVELVWAHDITTLFRESIGKDGLSKSVDVKDFQRQYKDGSWDVLNPIDVQKELEEETTAVIGGVPAWIKYAAVAALVAVICGAIYWMVK